MFLFSGEREDTSDVLDHDGKNITKFALPKDLVPDYEDWTLENFKVLDGFFYHFTGIYNYIYI